METKTEHVSEQLEFAEFRRTRRETELQLALRRITVNASKREITREGLKRACESAVRLGTDGVLVSPINASSVRRMVAERGKRLCCIVGGTGETLVSVKRAEARRVSREGAREIWFVPSASILRSHGASGLKREIKRVRRCVKKRTFFLLLDDPFLSSEEILLGVRAAKEAGADGVCVRGEVDVALAVLTASEGKLFVCCTGVENAEQLRLLLKIGVGRVCCVNAAEMAEEMRRAMEESLFPLRSDGEQEAEEG
ncbi:MAG: hypothetical protein J6C93_07100 [Clostridia bacterium]|nr:hypothetical protein [Clostridia bacterium]